jgi:hypothetical protein
MAHRYRRFVALLGGLVVGVACGGSTDTTFGDGGEASDANGASDAGATPDAKGTTDARGSSDGAACVTIDVASYDRSCSVDSDCTLVAVGTLCTGGCSCGAGPINKKSVPQYQADTAGVQLLACPCHAPGQVRCVQHTCTLCSYGTGNPPGCPDAG